jgi:hypothetical protein
MRCRATRVNGCSLFGCSARLSRFGGSDFTNWIVDPQYESPRLGQDVQPRAPSATRSERSQSGLVAEPDLRRRQGRSCDRAPSRIGKPLARVDKPGAPSASRLSRKLTGCYGSIARRPAEFCPNSWVVSEETGGNHATHFDRGVLLLGSEHSRCPRQTRLSSGHGNFRWADHLRHRNE